MPPTFAQQLDKVACYITDPANAKKRFTEKHLSETLGIERSTMSAIFNRLIARDFAYQTKSGSPEDGVIINAKDELKAFLLETSFEGETQIRDMKNHPTINVVGNNNAVGNTHSLFDKSFNPEISKAEPKTKRKIDWNTWSKIILGILIIISGLLKYFGII